MKFKKIPMNQVKNTKDQICIKKKCGKQPAIPIEKPIIAYEVTYNGYWIR